MDGYASGCTSRLRVASARFFRGFSDRQAQLETEFATYLDIIRELDFDTAIDIENSQSIVVKNNDMEGYFAGLQFRGVEGAKVVANSMHRNVYGIFSVSPEVAVSGAVIERNWITQSLDNGIDIRDNSERVVVRRNRVAFSGRSHISLQNGVRDSVIFGNQCKHGGFYRETLEFPGSSGISVNGVEDLINVRKNFVLGQVDPTNIDGNGLILDFVQSGNTVTVLGNVFLWNAGDGINTTESPNAVIRGNVLIGNGVGSDTPFRGAGVRLSRESDIFQTIENNLFIDNRSASISTSFNIELQTSIDRNVHFLFGEPVVRDGEGQGTQVFGSVGELLQQTGLEGRGFSIQFGR